MEILFTNIQFLNYISDNETVNICLLNNTLNVFL